VFTSAFGKKITPNTSRGLIKHCLKIQRPVLRDWIKYINAGYSIASSPQLATETLGCSSYRNATAHKGEVNILGSRQARTADRTGLTAHCPPDLLPNTCSAGIKQQHHCTVCRRG